MNLHSCVTKSEVEAAYDDFIKALGEQKGDTTGHKQMASDFKNGIAFWSTMYARKNKFYKATDGGKVIGLLRLEVQEDRVHIAQVTGFNGAGGELVHLAKAVALSLEKSKVDLSTADEGLPKYYEEKHGFKMVTRDAKTGQMVFDL